MNAEGTIKDNVEGGKIILCHHLSTLSNYSCGNSLHQQDETHVSQESDKMVVNGHATTVWWWGKNYITNNLTGEAE